MPNFPQDFLQDEFMKYSIDFVLPILASQGKIYFNSFMGIFYAKQF